jgi:hypothetical protein
VSSNNDSDDGTGPAVEYRSAPRYPILQRCFARPAGAQAAEGWRVIAYNISATGIAVALPLPLPLETILKIEPFNLPRAKPVRARIVHASPLEFVWLCGCQLEDRLGEDELRAWLSSPTLA